MQRALQTPEFLLAEARDFFMPRMRAAELRIAMDCVLD